MDDRPRKSRRRLLRFSLRALLVFVLLLSVPLAWFAWKMERARKQREAVEWILGTGGEVLYDYQVDEDYLDPLSLSTPLVPPEVVILSSTRRMQTRRSALRARVLRQLRNAGYRFLET